MLQSRKLQSRKLRIIVAEINTFDVYTTHVFEFQNGAILVPSEQTNCYFFESRYNYQPTGVGEVLDIIETEETLEWEKGELALAVIGSIREFGADTIPINVFQLFS